MSRLKTSYITSARLFCGAVVLCSVVLVTAFLDLKTARETYQQFRAGYSKQVQLAIETLENHEWLSVHNQVYADMVVNGTVGIPDKLVWVDFLAQLHRSVPVDNYHFEISPLSTHTVEDDLMLETADITIYGDLLHDGVLADLLTYISGHAPGGWYYQSMEVLRHPAPDQTGQAEGVGDRFRSSLEFMLTLTWVVIADKTADGAQT